MKSRSFAASFAFVIPIALAACNTSSSSGAVAVGSSDAAPTPAIDAGNVLGDAGTNGSRADAGAPFSKGDRSSFFKALDSGRKKSRAKDWTGALADFDRALAISPYDARALSEVGWAAFNAGDLDRAEKANKKALLVVKDANVRAAILYNQGRVAEAKKDNDGARKAYADSLALRDNAEVKKRLAAVGGAPEDSVACAAGAGTIDALCTCLKKSMAEEGGMMETWACALDPISLQLGTPKLGVVHYGAQELGERPYLLVARENGSLRPITILGEDYEPGAFGVHNRAEVTGARAQKFGAREVIVVKSAIDDTDMNMAGLEECDSTEQRETVCALGDGKSQTRCFPVPIEHTWGCGAGVQVDPSELDEDTRNALEERKKSWISSSVKLAWTVGADGKITVTKVSGDDALISKGLLGPHPLF